jgi:diguanylate cyclase (GGDEF)-like protein
MSPTNPQEDSLTGLLTRKVFLEEFSNLIQAATLNQQTFSLGMVDIDDFLHVNERYGHQAGDDVIIAVANVLKQSVEPGAILGRYGGDEYAILFPKMEREQAFLCLEKAREQIEKLGIPSADGKYQVEGLTISGGVSSFPIDGRLEAELLRKADHALYRAKDSGRNKIRLAYEERMVPKTTHFTVTQLERLSKLASEKGIGEAELLREALDELLVKYGVNEIES